MHQIDIPEEILARSRALRGRDRVFDRLDPARTAHVVVDLQNGFMREGAPVEVPMAREIVPQVNRITAALREAGGLIVYLRYTYDAQEPQEWSNWYGLMLRESESGAIREAFAPGAPDHALWDALDVQEGDLIVDKTRFSAFVPGTCDLDAELKKRGVDTLIITGTLTNCCCESTARDANQRNYKVIFAPDGNATHTDHEHNATLCNMAAIFADLQGSEEIARTLADGAGAAAAAE